MPTSLCQCLFGCWAELHKFPSSTTCQQLAHSCHFAYWTLYAVIPGVEHCTHYGYTSKLLFYWLICPKEKEGLAYQIPKNSNNFFNLCHRLMHIQWSRWIATIKFLQTISKASCGHLARLAVCGLVEGAGITPVPTPKLRCSYEMHRAAIHSE